MAVSTGAIIARGLTNRCPNCGSRTLFAGLLRAAERCRVCGLKFEREDGFFLGALVINYTVTMVLLLAPLLVFVFRQEIDVLPAVVIGIAWCIIFPILFYRPSKSLWLMTYYVFLPRDLPANGGSKEGSSRAQNRGDSTT